MSLEDSDIAKVYIIYLYHLFHLGISPCVSYSISEHASPEVARRQSVVMPGKLPLRFRRMAQQ